MTTLQPYKKYNTIAYDYYARQLPDGWQLLPNIAVFQERIERGHINEELLSVTIGRGVIRQTEVDIKKDSSNEDKSKYKLIKVGDIAYNKMRMWQGALGYSDYQGISSPAYVILKPKMKINPHYFHYMFRASFYTNYSKRFSYGIVDDQLSLRYTDFKRMYSIVPPIKVQNSIVSYLDKKNTEIEKFIRNKERLIELLEEEKRGKINIAITRGIENNKQLKETEIEWLGKIPFDWNIKKLKYITKLIADGTHVTPSYMENGFPFLRITDVEGDNINWEQVRYISPREHKELTKSRKGQIGDILLSKNGTIGKVIEVTWKEEFSFFVSLCLIRFKKVMLPKYFSYFFKSDIVYDQLNEGSKTTSVTNLHLEKIKELKIAFPEIKEQIRICNFLDEETKVFDLAISKAQKEISSIKEYREALITDLVTGKRSVPQLQMS